MTLRSYKYRPRSHRQRGNIMMEFALSALFLMMVFAGCAEFGRMFYYADVVNGAADAAREYCAANFANCTSSSPSTWTVDTSSTSTSGLYLAVKNSTGGTNFTLNTPSFTMLCYCGQSGTPTAANCASYVVTSPATCHESVQVTTSASFATLAQWPWVPSSVPLTGRSTFQVN